MKVVKNCLECGSSFTSESWNKRKFCSGGCSDSFKRGRKVMVNVCVECGKNFDVLGFYESKKRKFCSHKCSFDSKKGQKRIFTEEWKKNLSIAGKKALAKNSKIGFQKGHKQFAKDIGEIMTGRKPWNAGKKLIYKPRPSMKGHVPWNKGKKTGHTPWNKGKIGIMRGRMPKGSAHHNWRGGTRQLRKDIQGTGEYKNWRTSVFKRDDFTCVVCDGIGTINADHIKPFSEIILENKITSLKEALNCKELWDIDNGRTICVRCHRKTDSYGLKQVRKLKKLT